MKNIDMFKLFVAELEYAYNAEKQMTVALPKMIKAAHLDELKEALSEHLKETEVQVDRIEEIFRVLEIKHTEKKCKAMEGMIQEAEKEIQAIHKGLTLDAALIGSSQKIEHYEIASYGTLRSFSKHLDLGKEITELLNETLSEESAADKKLTKIADGSFFYSGLNKKAAEG